MRLLVLAIFKPYTMALTWTFLSSVLWSPVLLWGARRSAAVRIALVIAAPVLATLAYEFEATRKPPWVYWIDEYFPLYPEEPLSASLLLTGVTIAFFTCRARRTPGEGSPRSTESS